MKQEVSLAKLDSDEAICFQTGMIQFRVLSKTFDPRIYNIDKNSLVCRFLVAASGKSLDVDRSTIAGKLWGSVKTVCSALVTTPVNVVGDFSKALIEGIAYDTQTDTSSIVLAPLAALRGGSNPPIDEGNLAKLSKRRLVDMFLYELSYVIPNYGELMVPDVTIFPRYRTMVQLLSNGQTPVAECIKRMSVHQLVLCEAAIIIQCLFRGFFCRRTLLMNLVAGRDDELAEFKKHLLSGVDVSHMVYRAATIFKVEPDDDSMTAAVFDFEDRHEDEGVAGDDGVTYVGCSTLRLYFSKNTEDLSSAYISFTPNKQAVTAERLQETIGEYSPLEKIYLADIARIQMRDSSTSDLTYLPTASCAIDGAGESCVSLVSSSCVLHFSLSRVIPAFELLFGLLVDKALSDSDLRGRGRLRGEWLRQNLLLQQPQHHRLPHCRHREAPTEGLMREVEAFRASLCNGFGVEMLRGQSTIFQYIWMDAKRSELLLGNKKSRFLFGRWVGETTITARLALEDIVEVRHGVVSEAVDKNLSKRMKDLVFTIVSGSSAPMTFITLSKHLRNNLVRKFNNLLWILKGTSKRIMASMNVRKASIDAILSQSRLGSVPVVASNGNGNGNGRGKISGPFSYDRAASPRSMDEIDYIEFSAMESK